MLNCLYHIIVTMKIYSLAQIQDYESWHAVKSFDVYLPHLSYFCKQIHRFIHKLKTVIFTTRHKLFVKILLTLISFILLYG